MKWKIPLLIIALICATPFVVLNLLDVQASVQVPETEKAPVVAEKKSPAFPASPWNWLSPQQEIAEILATDRITGAHKITMHRKVEIDRYLMADTKKVDPRMYDLVATVRTPGLFTPFCDEIVGTIGHACKVTTTQARPTGGRMYDVSVDFGFVPNYDLGAQLAEQSGEPMTAIYSSNSTDRAQWPSYSRTSRVAIMDQAKSLCDAVRAEFGACIVSHIVFDEDRVQGQETKLGYEIHVTSFGEDTRAGRTTYEHRVAQLAAPIFQ